MEDITLQTRLAANLHPPRLESGQAVEGNTNKAQLAEGAILPKPLNPSEPSGELAVVTCQSCGHPNVHTLPFPRHESVSSDFESFTSQGKRDSTFHRGVKSRVVVGADSLEGPEFFKGIPGPKRGHRGVAHFAGVVWIGIGGNFAPISISYERCIILFLILLQMVSFPFVGMYLILCQDKFDCQITQSLGGFGLLSWSLLCLCWFILRFRRMMTPRFTGTGSCVGHCLSMICNTRPAELFISYSWHDDIFLARRVAQLLCRLGYCIWIDCACLPPGLPKEAEGKIGRTCRRAVEFCRTGLVVWGENYMKAFKAGRICKQEMDAIMMKEHYLWYSLDDNISADCPLDPRYALTKNATSWIGHVRSIPRELALEREVTSRKATHVNLKTGQPGDLPPQPPETPMFSWRDKLARRLSMSFSSSSLGGQERSKLQFLHATPSFEVENLTQRTEVEALANMLSAGTGIHFHLPVPMWRMWLLPVLIIFGLGGLLMLFVGIPTLDERYDTSWNHVALLLCANLPTALCFIVAMIIVFLVGPTSLSWYYYLQCTAKVENGPPAWVLAVLAFLKCCGKKSIAIYDSHTSEQVKMKRSVRCLLQMLGGQDQDDLAGKPLVTIVAVDRDMLTPGGPKSMTLEEFEAKFKNAEGGVMLIVAVPSFEDILKEVPKSPLLDWMGSGIVVHNRDVTDIFLDLDNAMRNNMGQFEECIAAAPGSITV